MSIILCKGEKISKMDKSKSREQWLKNSRHSGRKQWLTKPKVTSAGNSCFPERLSWIQTNNFF